jgi:transposase InsO family protein
MVVPAGDRAGENQTQSVFRVPFAGRQSVAVLPFTVALPIQKNGRETWIQRPLVLRVLRLDPLHPAVNDTFTRECLALEVDTGFASRRVTRVLDEIIAMRGLPQAIRCDNGPELTSRHFLAWALAWKIELRHIQPGKPTQNAHVESFHGRLREECLRVSWFTNLFDARRKVSNWKAEYNEQRPHSSLGYRTPAEFARVAITQSYGKDVGSAHLENACGVYHFPTAPAAG